MWQLRILISTKTWEASARRGKRNLGFSVPVHFSDKPLSTLSQRPVALTATGFALMASPWSHLSLIHCFSVAARKRTCWLLCSNLLGGWSWGWSLFTFGKGQGLQLGTRTVPESTVFFFKIPRNPSRWSSSFRMCHHGCVFSRDETAKEGWHVVGVHVCVVYDVCKVCQPVSRSLISTICIAPLHHCGIAPRRRKFMIHPWCVCHQRNLMALKCFEAESNISCLRRERLDLYLQTSDSTEKACKLLYSNLAIKKTCRVSVHSM